MLDFIRKNFFPGCPTGDTDRYGLTVALSTEDALKVSKARALLIQALGSKPLKLFLPVNEYPYNIWERLKEIYMATNTATKVQLQAKLNRMVYKVQSVYDYVATFETVYNLLSSMNCDVNEDMRVATLLASFGDNNKSYFG